MTQDIKSFGQIRYGTKVAISSRHYGACEKKLAVGSLGKFSRDRSQDTIEVGGGPGGEVQISLLQIKNTLSRGFLYARADDNTKDESF